MNTVKFSLRVLTALLFVSALSTEALARTYTYATGTYSTPSSVDLRTLNVGQTHTIGSGTLRFRVTDDTPSNIKGMYLTCYSPRSKTSSNPDYEIALYYQNRELTCNNYTILPSLKNGNHSTDFPLTVKLKKTGNSGSTRNISYPTYEFCTRSATVGQGYASSPCWSLLEGLPPMTFKPARSSANVILNKAPVINSNGGGTNATIGLNEGTRAVTTVSATDANNDTLTYSISGGTDSTLFTVNASSGALSFNTAPDFESPHDSNGDNLYTVRVTASDGQGGTDVQVITVRINNVDEDRDNDGLLDSLEERLGTDPEDADSDNDGLNDGAEDANGNGVIDAGETSPLDADSDDDGLSDGAEDANGNGAVDSGETDPLNADTDADGLQDGTELGIDTPISAGSSEGSNPVNYQGTDTGTFVPDSDTNTTTSPTNPDTDAGGACDGSLTVEGVCETVEDTNNNGRIDAGETDPTVGSDDPQAGLKLQLRVWLQGAFNHDTGSMHDRLRSQGLLPLQQPYANTAYSYTGTETTDAATLAVTGSDAIVDWLLVELWDAAANNRLASKATLLQRDGDLVSSSTGSTELLFPEMTDGDYQIVVRHRNHLDIRTLDAVTLNKTTPTLVDFTLPATAVMGSHARLIANGVALMWAGDVNANQTIIAQGPELDTNSVLTQVLLTPENEDININYILQGYQNGDLNMDGETVFAGPNNDVTMLIGNVLLHPDNTNLSANYIIYGGLK